MPDKDKLDGIDEGCRIILEEWKKGELSSIRKKIDQLFTLKEAQYRTMEGMIAQAKKDFPSLEKDQTQRLLELVIRSNWVQEKQWKLLFDMIMELRQPIEGMM